MKHHLPIRTRGISGFRNRSLQHWLPLFTTLAAALLSGVAPVRAEHALVLQTDFGTKDGAVAAMKGIAVGLSPHLAIYDLSHENTPFDIWEAAYRLKQAAPFWPAGTVFVSVIDPGVGTARKSVAVLTKNGEIFVGPDNGTWTLIAEDLGVVAVREIDETRHRRPGSEKSHTFHGRDVYVYTGAQLAAGLATFDEVGPLLGTNVVKLPYEKPRREGGVLIGTVPYLDFRFGNVWTNLGQELFDELEPQTGDRFRVTIAQGRKVMFQEDIPYARTFGDVPIGRPLLYLNSLMNVSFALNQGDLAKQYGIDCGPEWNVRV